MGLSVVILAAGKGTRMKSALPKVLHPIGGKPMVAHIIETSLALGAHQVNVVYGHGKEQLKDALSHYQVNWCEQSEQLGTGHAAKQALPYLNDNDDVLVLVGDAPLISVDTLRALVDAKKNAALALLTVDLDDPTGMGRIIRDGENIVAIVEDKDATALQKQITEINTGMMMMSVANLKPWLAALSNNNAQAEYYLTDVIAIAAKEGKVIKSAQPNWPQEVEGVNNRLQLSILERAFQYKQAEKLMLDGVALADPHRFDLRGNVLVGTDIFIDINVLIEGEVTIGNNVYIGPNCILQNCSIADGVRIEANSIIENASIGKNAVVGPFARLRPGAELHDNSKVGNFVEIKKSIIGVGSKVNHLSYMGDATIGKGVNVGAGTITCNYDGVNKSKTTIGDNAFIGSNSSLVAPVTIGDSATVGAGSTVTKSVDNNELAVARAKQRNMQGWERPKKK